MSDSRKSIVLALVCVLSWSFIPVVARFGQINLGNAQLLFWSNFLSVMVVGFAAIGKGGGVAISPRQLVQAAALGFLGCFIYYMLLYYAYAKENAIPVLVVQYSWPALVVIFSAIFLGEKLKSMHVVGLFLGASAIVITATRGRFDALFFANFSTMMIVFAGAVCFALFSVFSKKVKIDPIKGSFWFFVFGTLYSGVYCAYGDGVGLPSRASLVPVIANGAIINGLSYIFWVKSLSLSPASRVAPLVFVAPVLAAIWVSLFFNEPFHGIYFLGMALCIVSGLLCVHEPDLRAV